MELISICAEQEIRKCGDGWSYCDGNCEECYKSRLKYSNETDCEVEDGN